MKITYFNYMADLYGYSIGSTIKARKLLGSLSQCGHDVRFHWLCEQRQQKSSVVKSEKRSRLHNLLFTPKQLLRNIPQFFRELGILRRERSDLLIARLDAFRISALAAAWVHHLPVAIEADGASSYEWLTFNNGRHLWPKALLWCERLMLKGAVGIFTQSQIAKEYLAGVHDLAPEKIAVITNGADPVEPLTKEEADGLYQSLGLPSDRQIIGFVGSMHHWHGVDQVAALIGEVLSEFPRVVFLFVGGGGALEKALKNQLLSAHTSRVIFTGTVPYEQVNHYIQLFSIAIAPYPAMEVFYFSPVKLFEYMAAAKPIVAARIGQIAEILQDQQNGLLYEPGNIEDMKQKLLLLLSDELLRQRLASNAVQTFTREHTWRYKGDQLDDYLVSCLSKKSTKRERA
jgi:glycosyltransferase involved in cell wall biosynthesis